MLDETQLDSEETKLDEFSDAVWFGLGAMLPPLMNSFSAILRPSTLFDLLDRPDVVALVALLLVECTGCSAL